MSTGVAEPVQGLPASRDAERSILGGILLENACMYDCGELDEGMFAWDSHRRIYKRMREIVSANRAVDLVTLVEEFSRRKELKRVGGAAYLASLLEGLPRRLSIVDYVGIVREKWHLRRIMSICQDGMARAADQSEGADSLAASIDRELLEVTHATKSEVPLKRQVDAAFEELEALWGGQVEPAISTGVPGLDRLIGGYRRKRLYIVGGRPSMGKTSLMIQAAVQHCYKGIRVRLVSLEMTSQELLQRIIAAISGVNYQRLTESSKLAGSERQRVREAFELVKEWPLEIDDCDGQSIDKVIAGCRISCRQRGTQFVALDYVQILRFVGPGQLRHQEISDAVKRLRQFAKEEDVPVQVLSSITEAWDKNPNRRPVLSDLRGSGDVAFHADVVVLVHRERDDDGATIRPDTELLVAKQRGGGTGVAHAKYNTNTLMFESK